VSITSRKVYLIHTHKQLTQRIVARPVLENEEGVSSSGA
jgi:hypothetical protein